MKCVSLRWFEAEGRIVGLDSTSPNPTISTDHLRWMCVDRQQQSFTRVCTRAVIGLGGVPVPDQQAILVREVLYEVAQCRIIQETEVVRTGTKAVIVAAIDAELSDVGIEVEARLGSGCCPESAERPTEGVDPRSECHPP
jgi:hypothetical protein